MPWCSAASRIQRTTASGSRARIVRPMTFFTLQYEQVKGQPRDVSSVVMPGDAKRRQVRRRSIAGSWAAVMSGTVMSRAAGLGADAVGDAVARVERAAQVVVEDVAHRSSRPRRRRS